MLTGWVGRAFPSQQVLTAGYAPSLLLAPRWHCQAKRSVQACLLGGIAPARRAAGQGKAWPDSQQRPSQNS